MIRKATSFGDRDGGVVDQKMDRSERVRCGAIGPVEVVDLRQVCGYRHCDATGRLDLLDRLVDRAGQALAPLTLALGHDGDSGSRRAMAQGLPEPRLAPVTIAVRPFSRPQGRASSKPLDRTNVPQFC